jgi:putative membrane protein
MKIRFVSGAAIVALGIASVQAQQAPTGGATDQQGGRPSERPPANEPAGRTTGQSPTGQTPSQSTTATAARLSGADRKFVMEAAMGGKAEVELGQLATQKAQDPQVKQFGQQMVQDHSAANEELMKVAQQKGITLPTDLDSKHKDTANRLSKLSGAAFDRAYVQEMLSDHRKDVSEFREQSEKAKDPDIKAFATKTLPTLEHHLSMVQQLSGDKGTSGTTVPRPTGSTGPDRPTTPPRPDGTGSTPQGRER